MTRPFKVLGIQQIAIGATSKDRLRTLWVDMLGPVSYTHLTLPTNREV